MMKYIVVFVLIIVPALAGSIVNCFASDNTSLYDKANMHYQKLEYDSAIAIYEQLSATGQQSAEVCYNLGNSYYKTGYISKAILNYERALKINPKDEDAQFNLHVAQLKVVDKIEPVPQIFYNRWIKNMTALFTPDTWTAISLALLWITFVFGAVYIFSKYSNVRQFTFILILIFIVFTAASLFFAHQSYVDSEVKKKAIIVSSTVYVKSSPDEKGNDMFILHEGTKVEVLDDFLDWKKIRIANGSLGWLKDIEMEQI